MQFKRALLQNELFMENRAESIGYGLSRGMTGRAGHRRSHRHGLAKRTHGAGQCAICHTADKGGDNRLGPNLFGIIGKKAGAAASYQYTNAFRTRANWEWTEDALGGWVMAPSTMIPGTAMGGFQGIADRDREDLLAYLATLK
jgi:cytochrome c